MEAQETHTANTQHSISPFARACTRLVLSALLFFILGIIFPELREKIPHFYHLIDGILEVFDRICDVIVGMFEIISEMFA